MPSKGSPIKQGGVVREVGRGRCLQSCPEAFLRPAVAACSLYRLQKAPQKLHEVPPLGRTLSDVLPALPHPFQLCEGLLPSQKPGQCGDALALSKTGLFRGVGSSRKALDVTGMRF